MPGVVCPIQLDVGKDALVVVMEMEKCGGFQVEDPWALFLEDRALPEIFQEAS